MIVDSNSPKIAELTDISPEERLAIVIQILAAGVRRSLAAQSSFLFANIPESSLDFSRPKSGRALRRVRQR